MSTNFFTNQDGNTLFEKFSGIFSNQSIHYFEALVGYFRSTGYFKLRPLLENVPEIRILVGINVDHLVKKYQNRGEHYLSDPDQTEEAFLKQVVEDIQASDYDKEIEDGITQLIEDLLSGKVKIRASGKRDLHAKIYIMRPENFNEHNSGSVITGSSNLSKPGLGWQSAPNYEFNVLLERYDDVQFALNEFEKLWDESDTVLPEDFSRRVKTQTHLNDSLTPYELYLKMLIEYFGEAVDQEEIVTDQLPKGYMRLQYQMDAVVDGFKTLKRHNGVILADVVGLGKTIIATQIIKRYVQYNGFNTRVLVIHSPALRQNWLSTLRDFGLTTLTELITNGSLHKVIDPEDPQYLDPSDFDLIVVDESHGFRSETSDRYSLLQLITKTPRKKAGGDEDLRKKVILMSATPLNNQPEDIANQIYLFQDARSSSIPNVPNLQNFFAPLAKRYERVKKIKDHKRLVNEVKDIYRPIRDKVMNHLVIRRTRSDIEKIPAYRKDMEQQNLSFPDINGPNNIHYFFDETLTYLFNESVEYLLNGSQNGCLGYFRYRAIEFLCKEEHRERYDNIELISKQLAVIMQNRLVKRLESSFKAFTESLRRLTKSNQWMIDMIENDKVLIAPDLDSEKFFREGRLQELEDKILNLREEAPNNNIYQKEDFSEDFILGLKSDQIILEELNKRWNNINEDPKLDKFLGEVDKMVKDPRCQEGKIVIFSESTETVNYVTNALRNNGYKDTLNVSANNQNSRFKTIRRN
jgi:HKD family nuclease